MYKIEKNSLPFHLLLGLAVTAIIPVFVFSVLLTAPPASLAGLGIETIIASLLFASLVFVWWRYSQRIATAGGLYEFVRQAAGEKIAKIEGWLWIFSYALYLPYTVTYIVYLLLPQMYTTSADTLIALEIVLPVLLSIMVIYAKRATWYVLLAIAIAQIAIVILVGSLAIASHGADLAAFSTAPGASALGIGAVSTSLLLICLNILFFFGGEAKGGARAMRNALIGGFSIGVVLLVFSGIAFSGTLGAEASSASVPGFSLAGMVSTPMIQLLLALILMAANATLIIIEYLGVGRLVNFMTGFSVSKTMYILAIFFVITSVLGIANPIAFYSYLTYPSVIALFISQFIVFAVFPLYARKKLGLTALDILAAVVASVLMLYGVYSMAISPPW